MTVYDAGTVTSVIRIADYVVITRNGRGLASLRPANIEKEKPNAVSLAYFKVGERAIIEYRDGKAYITKEEK